MENQIDLMRSHIQMVIKLKLCQTRNSPSNCANKNTFKISWGDPESCCNNNFIGIYMCNVWSINERSEKI